MVLRQAVDHFVERAQARRRENASLAHAAADHFAHPAGALDEIGPPGQHGADRRTQSLGEAEHHRIDRTGELADVDPLRYGGIEDPGPVPVDLQAGPVGHEAERFGLARAQTGTALAVVGVLEAEHGATWLVDIRFSNGP